MSILLYKSYRRLQQSRIRHFNWHSLFVCQLKESHRTIMPPLTSRLLFSQHIHASTFCSDAIYPTLSSSYSTLAAQSISSDTTSYTSSPWLSASHMELRKLQQLVNSGKDREALDYISIIPPPPEHILNDSESLTRHAELLDPYAVLLERRLQLGQWEEGIVDYHRLVSSPWRPLILHNRRIIKATMLMYCAQGNWIECERMLRTRKIKMTPKTVARMMATLMGLRVPSTSSTAGTKQRNTKTANNHNDNMPYAVSGKYIVRSLQAFERILDIQVNGETLAVIIGYLGDRGKIEDAYRLYRWARGEIPVGSNGKQVLPPEKTRRCSLSIIYLAMIESAIINNDITKAVRIWRHRIYRGHFSMEPSAIKYKPPTLSAYNILLNIYASQLPEPKLPRVRRTYRRLLNAGHSPNNVTYNTLIKAFVNVGNTTSAYQVFETMLRSGTHPDSWTISTLLRGSIEKREWHEVEYLLKKIQQIQKQVERLDGADCDSENNVKCQLLGTHAFNILVKGFLQLDRRTLEVEHVLKSHKDWSLWRHLKRSNPIPYRLTSPIIWDIFEAVTGQQRSRITEFNPLSPSSSSSLSLSSSVLTSSSSALLSSSSASLSPASSSTSTRILTSGSVSSALSTPSLPSSTCLPANESLSDSFNQSIFASLFQHEGFNQVSCKLFIKAFLLAKDYDSAEKMKYWMFRSYPPISKKKPLI